MSEDVRGNSNETVWGHLEFLIHSQAKLHEVIWPLHDRMGPFVSETGPFVTESAWASKA